LANPFARRLRASGTDAERVLWAGLRNLKQVGLHFRRQAPFGKYVADFACHGAKLIVELDGDQHGTDENAAYDAERTAYLNSRGYCVIRFANWEALKERQRVLDYILHVAQSPTRLAATRTICQMDRLADLPARGR
jgi:very-short-patch-repair endonuclease